MTGLIATAEATLCRIFADVLGLDVVGRDDAFFEVGGDSVLALQVVARARAAGLALSVRDLFDHQTPRTLAAVPDDRPGAASAGAAAPPPESQPLTFAGDGLADFDDADFDDSDVDDSEFGEFNDAEIGPSASGTEAGWEQGT
jgi:hypothetical protein